MAKTHGFLFTTLRDCFIFFCWLYEGDGKPHMDAVVVDLLVRIAYYYNTIDEYSISLELSNFLGHVTRFYRKLVFTVTKDPASIPLDLKVDDIVNALLECLPTFLAAMYYLWYNVDVTFKGVGGGRWAEDWPGWGGTDGGNLDRYLHANSGSAYGGIIPGGFIRGEVRYGRLYANYTQGKKMTTDLRWFLDKKVEQNYLRDVFILSTSTVFGAESVNTANAICLVGVFCEIIMAGEKNGELRKALENEVKPKCIDWDALQRVCGEIKVVYNNMFTIGPFDHTGVATTASYLKSDAFAVTFVTWFRTNYTNMIKNVGTMHSQVIKTSAFNHQSFASTVLFPNGIVFKGNNVLQAKGFLEHWVWEGEIESLGNESSGSLKTLKDVLEGYTCPPSASPPKVPETAKEVLPEKKVPIVPPKKPEAPTTTLPEDPKKVVPEKKLASEAKSTEPVAAKTEATKTEAGKPTATTTEVTSLQGNLAEASSNQGKKAEGAQNQGKKAEGAQNQGKKAEGTPNQGKKAEGAQNQGKKADGTPDGGNGQSRDRSLASQIPRSASDSTISAKGDAGPEERKGEPGMSGQSGQVVPESTHVTSSAVPQAANVKNVTTQENTSPATSSPSPRDTAATGSGGTAGVQDAGSHGNHSSGDLPSASSSTAITPSATAVDSEPPSSGGIRTGGPPGAQGTTGDEGQQAAETHKGPCGVGCNDSVGSSESSVQDPVLTQQHAIQWTSMSPSPSSPSNAATPEVAGTQGDLGADISAVVQPALQTVLLPDGAKTLISSNEPQVPSAHSPTASSRNAAAPAPPVPLGDPDQSLEGGGATKSQSDPPLQAAPPQPPNITGSISKPSSVLDPSGAYSPDSGQRNSQRSQKGGRSSTTTSDTDTTVTLPGQSAVGGDGAAPGSGGDARGAADGDSQDKLKTLQPPPQLPTTSDSIAASTASLGDSSAGGSGLTPPSPPVQNSNPHGTDTINLGTTTVSSPHASDPLVSADAAGKQDPQPVGNHDNGPQGQPGLTNPVAAPPAAAPPGAPKPATSGTPSDSDSDLQTSADSAQDPTFRQAASVQSSGSSSSGVSDTDSDPGAPGTNGDQGPQGSRGPVIPQSSLQHVQADLQIVKQEPSPATSSPDAATSPQLGRADVGDHGLQSDLHPAQLHDTSQTTAIRQPSIVSGSVSSSSGSVSSDPIQQPNDQLGSQDNQQSAQGSRQSLSATKLTALPVQSSDSGVSVPGGVGTSPLLQPQVPDIEIVGEVEKFNYAGSDAYPKDVQNTEKHGASKVSFDIIKPTIAAYDKHFQSTPSLTSPVGLNPLYDVINDTLGTTTETHPDPGQNMDLFIDVVKHPPSQPIAEYDPEYIHAAPKLGRPKVDDLDDLALKDAEREKMYTSLAVFPGQSPFDDNPNVCQAPWYAPEHSTDLIPPIVTLPPVTDHLHSPKTVREMLYWLVGVLELGYIGFIRKHVDVVLDDVNTGSFLPTNVLLVTRNLTTVTSHEISQALTGACHYAAKVLHRLKHRDISKDTSIPEFNAEYSQLHYSSDPDGLLCQLRDYVYACCHQLQFLKAQCAGDKFRGGWMGCYFGQDVTVDSPLQAYLTDAYYSKFKTHFFDPCDVCLKTRIRMGFRKGDFSKSAKGGSYLYYLLSPSCSGDDDPLMTLSSYLNCISRRTPRTTGELVSFFQHFGSEMREDGIGILSDMGKVLYTPHPDCPIWDHLGRHDLDAVRGIRVSEPPVSKHDNDHAGTLSTLVGCDMTNVQCTQVLSPITHRAYTVYSPCFAHTYLSWVVYLADTLRESLDRLRYDFTRHEFSNCGSIHHCQDALPYLYFHGFTPPEGTSTSLVTCSQVIAKLEEVVNGGPIARLIHCMDEFLYRVRWPFIYTVIALWSTAFLLFAHTALYRLDVLRIQSHFMRSRGSHVIDVKALLTDGTKMPSLYDIDYFDDEALAHAWNRIY